MVFTCDKVKRKKYNFHLGNKIKSSPWCKFWQFNYNYSTIDSTIFQIWTCWSWSDGNENNINIITNDYYFYKNMLFQSNDKNFLSWNEIYHRYNLHVTCKLLDSQIPDTLSILLLNSFNCLLNIIDDLSSSVYH